ncbi:MAG: hypothetical protein K9N23_10470 [Akkermansiaceae bacterium]|nr:hypothetical protein [Akkermansiaceae bacterium]
MTHTQLDIFTPRPVTIMRLPVVTTTPRMAKRTCPIVVGRLPEGPTDDLEPLVVIGENLNLRAIKR